MKIIVAKEINITTDGSVIEGWANGVWDLMRDKFDENDDAKSHFKEGYFSGYNDAVRQISERMNLI